MSDVNEQKERIEEAGHRDKGIALMIAVLALLLAVSEIFGKGAQTATITDTVDATDTWAFYQAKNIRSTTVDAVKTLLEIQVDTIADPAKKAAADNKIKDWERQIERWQSDQEKGVGMDDLKKKAERLDKSRSHELEQYHNFEIASAALQIGIVLASAAILVSMVKLAWFGGGLCGLFGVGFMWLGHRKPELLAQLMDFVTGSHTAVN